MGDILISGAVKPTTTNTPTDARTRVETEADIEFVENPFVGMIIYCRETRCYYSVTSLKPKMIGNIDVPDALIDMEGLVNITESIKSIVKAEVSNAISKAGGYDAENGILIFDEIESKGETTEETDNE